MLTLKNITLRFGGPPLLDRISLVVERGERVCVLGRNGEGKSTLLRVIAGTQVADDGELIRSPGMRIAEMPQDIPQTLAGTVRDADTKAPVPGVKVELAGGLGAVTDAQGQFRIDQRQNPVGAGDHLPRIEAGAEQRDEAGGAGAEGDRAGRDGEPTLHPRGSGRILGQPIAAPELLREVDEDGVGIRHDRPVVVEDGNLPERVDREKIRRTVLPPGEIDLDGFIGLADQRQEQACPVGMARERQAVELHGVVSSRPRDRPWGGSHSFSAAR